MNKYIIQIILILLGTLFLITSFTISTEGFDGDILNQRNYVVILAVLLIGLSLLNAAYIKFRSQDVDSDAPNEEGEENEPRTKQNKNTYLLMIMLVIYAFGVSYVGFFVSSFILAFSLAWYIQQWEAKKWLSSIIFSSGLTLTLYILFGIINVYLPETLLF